MAQALARDVVVATGRKGQADRLKCGRSGADSRGFFAEMRLFCPVSCPFFSMACRCWSGLVVAEIHCAVALFPAFQPAAALLWCNRPDPLRLLGSSLLTGPSWAPSDPLFAEIHCAAVLFAVFCRPRPLIRVFR